MQQWEPYMLSIQMCSLIESRLQDHDSVHLYLLPRYSRTVEVVRISVISVIPVILITPTSKARQAT